MSEHRTAVDVAIAFTEAWTSHDMTTAARYVDDEVVFEGPMSEAAGITGYIEGLSRFAQMVTGLEILAVVGDDERAMIMYEVTTGPFGKLRAAEDFVFSGDKITRDTLVFDTHAMRGAREADAPSA